MTDLEKITNLLDDYLKSFPEHDQGDIRVWEAKQILDKYLNGPQYLWEMADDNANLKKEVDDLTAKNQILRSSITILKGDQW